MKVESVTVIDPHDSLPLREVASEDGPKIVAPDHGYILEARTARGEIFLHYHTFPFTTEGRKAAYKLRMRIQQAGMVINHDHWSFFRNEYGSAAYEREVIDVLMSHGNFENAERAGYVI